MGLLNLLQTAHCCSKLITPSENIKEFLSKETPGDRVKRMYSVNEFGLSPEIHYVISSGITTVVLAGGYGGIKAIIHEQKEFIRKNLASTYESQHLARRNLVDRMTLAGLNGAFKYGIKFGAFSTLYLLSTFTIANYRNKMTPWEHSASVAVIGGLSRINHGFKGMLVSSILGGFLGLLAGSAICLGMKFSGLTMEDLRCLQHEEYYLLRKKNSKSKLDDLS